MGRKPAEPPPKRSSPRYSSLAERDHFAAIGRVAVGWSFFEFFLDHFAAELLKLEDHAAICLQAQVIGPARKMDAYIAAARWATDKKFLKDLEEFARDTTRLAEQRNRVIHDSWIVYENLPPHRFEITAKRLIRREAIPMPTEDVIALSDKIISHNLRFRELHERILASLEA